MRIQATTRLLAVVGDPIGHSLSPAMHNAAIAALGLDAVYLALRAPAATFATLVCEMLAAGGALNVTVPHKRAAAALTTRPTEAVRRSGACNTLWPDGDGIAGDNTDIAAIAAEARLLAGGLPVRRALLLGSGGAARAAALALADVWKDAEVLVRSRDAARAGAFAEWANGEGVRCRVWGVGETETADLVVNATPLGLKAEDPAPIGVPELAAARVQLVLDLVYGRGGTRLVAQARAAGLRAADGRGVLVAQGAAAFERFFGVTAPIEVMRAAVDDALGA
jgi:shikimate dehydrogenase